MNRTCVIKLRNNIVLTFNLIGWVMYIVSSFNTMRKKKKLEH